MTTIHSRSEALQPIPIIPALTDTPDHGGFEVQDTRTPEAVWAAIRQESVLSPNSRKPKIWTFDEVGKPICGAKNGEGYPCRKDPMQGKNRCYYHGGKSIQGVNHPRFKTGKYSDDLIGNVQERYQSALNDKTLLHMDDEIAMTEARISDLLLRVNTGESGATWKAIKKTYALIRPAAAQKDVAKVFGLLNDLGQLINKGAGEYDAWDETFRMVKTKGKLVEAERKHMIAKKQMMTADEAAALMAFIANVIKSNILEELPGEQGQRLMNKISLAIARHVANRKGRGQSTAEEDTDDDA